MILLQNSGIQIIIIIVIKKKNHILFIYNSDVSHSMLCLLSSTTTKSSKPKYYTYVWLSMISKEICAIFLMVNPHIV